MPRYVTNSELGTWRRCRRKWWLNTHRRLGIKPEYQKPGAAYTGTMVHDSLEALYNGDDPWAPFAEHANLIQVMDPSEGDRFDKFMKMHELATVMVEGYLEWLEDEGADSTWEILSSEEILHTPFIETEDKVVHLRGKIDLRIRDHALSEQPVFVDHKTVPNLTEIPRDSGRNEQFLFYEILHRAVTGEETGGGVFNMLRKVKRTSRSNPPFYGRHVVRFNERQIGTMKKRITALINEILTAEGLLENGVDHQVVVPPTPTASCDWECEYAGICNMFDDSSRVEDYIEDWYREQDPMERYQKEHSSSE